MLNMNAVTSLQLAIIFLAVAISASAKAESNDTWYAFVGETVNLSCRFGETYPPLMTTWRHNGTLIIPQKNSSIQRQYSSIFDTADSKAWLEIRDVKYSDAGLYTCRFIHSGNVGSVASWTLRVLSGKVQTFGVNENAFFGFTESTTKVPSMLNPTKPTQAPKNFRWLVIIILIFLLASLFAGMVFFLKWLLGKIGRRSQYYGISKRTLPSVPLNFTRKESVDADIYNDITEVTEVNECKEIKEIKYMKGDRTLLRENKQTEKIREEAIVFEMQLKSDDTKQTWYGTFERKRKGKVPVLISTAPETVDLRLHTQWYRHASSIVKLPSCDYIVSTLGLCIKSENVFLVQEYLPNGSLRDDLGSFKTPASTESIDEATLHTFVSYTMNITSGLDFLSAHGWVHPGLTADKVLLSFDKTCKLYDFCSLGDATLKLQSIIRKKGKEKAMQLPPESFDLTDYTSRSDVWALGIVMWEIFSCGQLSKIISKPPASLANHDYTILLGADPGGTEPDFPKGAFSNRESCLGKLLKPEFCPTIVYRAITLCWARDPWSRPSFQDLKEYLKCALEIHQLAKATNKSRGDRPSDELEEQFLADISYDKDMATADISDTCL